MKLRDFIPPVIGQTLAGFAKRSFAGWAAAWMRGDDVVESGSVARLSRPWAQSAWVHAAINHVTGEIAGRELEFRDDKVEFEDAGFADWWSYPALGPRTAGARQPRLALSDTLRDLAGWAKHEGEFFLLLDDSWALAGLRRTNYAALNPFLIANPRRMRLIVQSGELQGYEYIDAGGRRSVYLPEQVYHWKSWNPYDDWRGVGDLESALVASEGAFYTGIFIRELMRNNGDTGFIVLGKGGPADDAQREQVKAALREKRAALRGGRAVDLFLSGGDMTVERPQQQAAGAELVQNKSLSQQEVFVAFGVPPSMAEVKASYSIGKDSDYYQLIIRTCVPLGNAIAGIFGKIGSRMAARPLRAFLDWDDHPVMVEVRNSRIDSGLKLWGAGMPMQSINDYLALGMKPFAGWDVGYLPFSVVPVDSSGASAASPDNSPALGEGDDTAGLDPQVESIRALLLLRARTLKQAVPAAPAITVERDVLAGFQCGCGCGETDLVDQRAGRDPAEIAAWREHMKHRREQVKGFESRFRSALFKARAETLAKIAAQAAKSKAASVTKAGAAADFLFNLAGFAADLAAGMRKQHRLALDAAGKQVYQELGRDDPFSFAPKTVLDFIAGRENKLAGVPPDVFSRIKDTLQAGLDAGDTMDALADRVRAEFNAIDKGRAQVIAQTETAAAYGFGRNEAMRTAGVEYKAWLTSGNANVRAAHQDAGLNYPRDGGIPLDEPFVVGDEELMYPGDPAGSPANTVNCHCIQIAVPAPEPL